MKKPVDQPIAVTMGEPAGIGPDLAVMAHAFLIKARAIVIGDPALIQQRATMLGLQAPVRVCQKVDSELEASWAEGMLPVHPVENAVATKPGVVNPAHARYVLGCLDVAIKGCQASQYAAIVTGPVHKGMINEAGYAFTGHTEYLASASDIARVVMMLVSGQSRVALVTTHLALTQVSEAITPEAVCETVRLVVKGLRQDFGIQAPAIAVCGLNPHAGEGGHLGHEEQTVIQPAIAHLNQETGQTISGPWPADTLFVPRHDNPFDAIVAMYHDQGLAPLKAISFGQTVNVTLGLPFIRTSVDHGTALSIAGTGQAEAGSFVGAVKLARELADQRRASWASA